MLPLFSEQMRRHPYPVYDAMRQSTPAWHEETFDVWMIFDYDGVKRALSDHEVFTSCVPAPEWFIFFDPPRHTKLRALVLRAFTPRMVANLEPRIRELSRDLLDQTIERGEMDLAADYAVPLPMLVIEEMLGIPEVDRAQFQRWSDAMLDMSYTILGKEAESRAAMAQFVSVTEEMRDYLEGLIEQRQRVPRDDLLTRLVEAEVDGERLSVHEILGFFQLLLVGGQETTTNLINNAILTLLDHPDQLARLRGDPDLLPTAIEEVLRYRSPLQWILRGTRRDTAIHGQVIPAGKLVLPMIGSANRDPQVFSNPDRFDIQREPNAHLAFGHGVHFCLGAPLARLEARIALTDLLERVQGIEYASAQPWPPRQALHVHGPARLPIRFTPGRRCRR